MYSRSYYPEEEKIRIPENYDGNALREVQCESEPKISIPMNSAKSEPKISPRESLESSTSESEVFATADENKESEANDEVFAGIFNKLPFGNIFSKKPKFKNFKIGVEEILLFGVALFLFFSKDGDKECAAFILLLLFID